MIILNCTSHTSSFHYDNICRMYRVLLFLVSIYGSIRGMQFPNKGDLPRQYHPRFLMYEEPYNIEFKYHNYEQMSRFLRATSLRFQNLTALYSIGKSVKGTNSLICVKECDTNTSYVQR